MLVRKAFLAVLSVFALALLPADLFGQEVMARDAEAPDRAALIENALSAAPETIAAGAAVADWEGNVLREGTNDYTCLPDDPNLPGNSPMCLDSTWMTWADAWMNQTEPPTPDAIAFGYMLQGDFPTSNTDPYAMEPTDDNEWIEDAGPHIMALVPDALMLEGISTDHENGGPWIMWRDTPYAHVMIPAAARK